MTDTLTGEVFSMGKCIAVIIIAIIVIFVCAYNFLVNKRNKVKNALSSIDVMLKKRFDLIPNLYDLVKKYMEHEKEILEKITMLRSKVEKDNVSENERIEQGKEMDDIIKQVNLTAENYPDLKSSNNFLQLQGTLSDIEEQISAARRTYNANATEYNTHIEMLPMKFFAFLLGFKEYKLIEAEEHERVNRYWFRDNEGE